MQNRLAYPLFIFLMIFSAPSLSSTISESLTLFASNSASFLSFSLTSDICSPSFKRLSLLSAFFSTVKSICCFLICGGQNIGFQFGGLHLTGLDWPRLASNSSSGPSSKLRRFVRSSEWIEITLVQRSWTFGRPLFGWSFFSSSFGSFYGSSESDSKPSSLSSSLIYCCILLVLILVLLLIFVILKLLINILDFLVRRTRVKYK